MTPLLEGRRQDHKLLLMRRRVLLLAWRKKTTTNISEEELSVLGFFWCVGVIRLLVFVQDTDDVARG